MLPGAGSGQDLLPLDRLGKSALRFCLECGNDRTNLREADNMAAIA